MGRIASGAMNLFGSVGDVYSAAYHTVSGDSVQARKDLGKAVTDVKGITRPRTADELADYVPDPVDPSTLAPVGVDPNALALRRQRLLASSYGRGSTVLANAGSTSLGSAGGGTQLGL